MSTHSTVRGRKQERMCEDTGLRHAGRNGSSGLKRYFPEKQEGDAGERGHVEI